MPIGLPNCSRLFACSIASSSAFCAMPTASAARAAKARVRVTGPSSETSSSSYLRSPLATSACSSGGELRQRERHGGEVRPGVERPPQLLEQHRLLDEAEPGAARLLGHGDAEPAQLGQLVPRRLALVEQRARLAAQLVLLFREGESHLDLGRPSTRSAMMLRRISDVPASIVLPRVRSWPWRHHSSASPSWISSASFVEPLHRLRPLELRDGALRAGDARLDELRQRAVVRELQRLELDPLARDHVAEPRVVGRRAPWRGRRACGRAPRGCPSARSRACRARGAASSSPPPSRCRSRRGRSRRAPRRSRRRSR